MAKANTAHLHRARTEINDEFYTQLEDIEDELWYYRPLLAGKRIYLPCDNPRHSKFWTYFANSFDELQLASLTATYYTPGSRSEKWEMTTGDATPTITPLKGDGDVLSDEAQALITSADIIVTNPPFSLFRDFMGQLLEAGKDYIIMGPLTAASSPLLFPLIRDGVVKPGKHDGGFRFRVPAGTVFPGLKEDDDGKLWRDVGPILWYTSLTPNFNVPPHPRHQAPPPPLPQLDNYDAININRMKDLAHVPTDYTGVVAVPVTYLSRQDRDRWEIVGNSNLMGHREAFLREGYEPGQAELNGRKIFTRIFIRRK